ncbi:DUF2190 family protein [Sphingomonas changnyeongensis]|uniref:DUF2190 family protein n=1 Tax=Sphingomonas changnyeongensis TaxID=2698679 RepID=A0A7Z2NWC1_9SPHN|nr:DUF2190 family protein [Sphingomonas changnyeongensis]QHL90692.1 DUF2190 family protein [Sphingomonas changnyeongensis]
MQQRPVLEYPIITSAAIARKRFVTYARTQAVANERALGVADYEAAAARPLNVVVLGTATVETGGAVAVGDEVQSDAQGRAIVRAAGVANGRALTPATAAGQMIEILLIKN